MRLFKIVFLLLILVHQLAHGQKLISGEYFFDTDPGFGNATSFIVSTPADSVDLSFSINTNGLSSGLHNLYFRMRNDSNVWSLTENRLVNIYTPTNNPSIVAAEYFFDNDPGFGAATALAATSLTDSIEITASIAIGTIAPGLHNLYLRTQNNSGVWSLTENRVLNVFKQSNNQIVWLEYFFNTDPGFGNGTGSPTSPAADSVELTSSASIVGLGTGPQTISMRTRNSDGVWSLTETRNFNGCDSIGPVTQIYGDTALAACIHQDSIVFSVDTVYNADYYVWTLPFGASIISGDSTNSITVNFSPYSSSGFVTVAGGYSGCTGIAAVLAINFKPIPVVNFCEASIDTTSQKTQLSWQRNAESYAKNYIVFREIGGSYLPLDTLINPSAGRYTDTDVTARPDLHPERYKIAVLDSCGNTGDTSLVFEHRTIHLNGAILNATFAKLYWTDYLGNTDPNRSYTVMRDVTGSGPFSVLEDSIPVNTLNYTDFTSGSCPNCRYYIALISDLNCDPDAKLLANKSTTRSNIKTKSSFTDSITSIPINLDQYLLKDVKVYPNPAQEIIYLDGLISTQSYQLKCFNVTGQLVYFSPISGKRRVDLPVKAFPKGLYLLQLISNGKMKQLKIEVNE